MNLRDLIFISLAAWRIASLLVREDGPFDIFEKIRRRFQPYGDPLEGIGKMLACVWCTAVWTAIACYLIWVAWELPIILLAASAIAVVIEEKLTK